MAKKERKQNDQYPYTRLYFMKEIKKLSNKAKRLWKQAVMLTDGNKCVMCGTTKNLNAHHIEDYRVNPILRYDVRNGVCLCASDHKFRSGAAHKGFVKLHAYIYAERPSDIPYLLSKIGMPSGGVPYTIGDGTIENIRKHKEWLEEQIKILEEYIEHREKLV